MEVSHFDGKVAPDMGDGKKRRKIWTIGEKKDLRNVIKARPMGWLGTFTIVKMSATLNGVKDSLNKFSVGQIDWGGVGKQKTTGLLY